MRKMEIALEVQSVEEIASRIVEFLEMRMPEGLIGKLKMLPKLAEMGAFFPKMVSKAPCQEVVRVGEEARLSELPDGANAVFANEEAALRLDGEDPALAVQTLGEWYRLASVTLGARGALATLDGRVETVEPDAVLADAPGSGDAFAATLLVRIATGDDLSDALARAAQAALDSLA